jgi:phosphatidylinositol alpha-1,6-mannosyltransferase
MLGSIGKHVDVSTYLSEYQRVRLAPLLRNLERLTPGVDTDTFHPDVSGEEVRKKYDLSDRPTIVCVSRLVPRKGQDMLIRALPAVKKRVPDAKLLIVSGGPDRDRLAKVARGQEDDVIFTGSVPWESLPEHYAAGDVYAMPCRTRRQGLDVEGLGIVYLEASATGLPVVAGNSGGAPDAVRENETGYVVDGRDVPTIADRLVTLLTDRDLASRMGAAGRAWVEKEWRWDTQAERLTKLIKGEAA